MNEIMKVLLSLSLSGTLLLLFILSLKLLYKNKFSRRWQYYIWIIVAFRFLIPFSFGTTIVGSMFERFGTAKITDETTVSQKKPVLLKEGNENETEPAHATMNEYETGKTLPALNGSESDGLQPVVNENKTGQTQSEINEEEAGQTQSEINEKETGQTQLGKNENDTGRTWFKMNHGTEQARPPSDTKKSIIYLFSVWLILTLILLVRKITIYQGFIRYIRIGNIEVSDIKTLNLLSDCREKLNIRTKIEIYRNPLIISPMMVGFFRPYIILPDGEFKDRELSYIFMHELIHCKQKDMFYKWLIQIVVCLHWFNPFVYLLEKEVNKACELSCDEKVISALDDEERREYGDTLISFMKEVNPYKNSLASVTMSEGAEQIKERLGAIMNYKKKSKIIITVTTLLSAAFIACFFVTGAYAKPSVSKGNLISKGCSEILNLVVETAANIGEVSDKVPSSSVNSPSGTMDNVSRYDYLPVASEYCFKQIQMFDENTGWALTEDNEILFTESGIKDFAVKKEFADMEKSTDGFINADFPDVQTAYVTCFSQDTTYIVVEYTKNKGKDWNRTMIDYSKFSDKCDAGSAYISFADEKNGYLLCCSTPGAGLMTKLLFRTTDGGKNFSFVSDLSNKIESGYPQGITFNGKDNGYMAVSYHGLENAYLYTTKDGGRIWKSETMVQKNEDISYIEAVSSPVFYGENKQKGILVLKLAGENAKYVLFGTYDGVKWTQAEKIPLDSVVNFSAVDDKHFFFTDITGNLYEALKYSKTPDEINKTEENKDRIYIYDEETGIGYYKGEDWEDWDWEDWKEEDWDWDDEDWDWDWDWDDKDLIREYASHGIEKKGKSYYYKGELVKIIKDQRPDSSFYMLDINSKGTACIKVVRNKKNKITGVSYMTEKEKEKLLKRAAPEPDKLPVTDKIPVINTTKWDVSGILTVDARYKADNVYILPSPDNNIILKEYITEHKPDYCANTKIKNNVLTIRSGTRPKKNYSSYIEIYIPDGALDNVKVKTVSGAITATNLKSIAALSSVSGEIDISDSEVEGNISTVSGEINISGSGVKGNISTVSGGIKLFPSAVSGDLRVNSHSGKIAAHFPDSTGYKLKANTYTGNIKGSLFNTKSRNVKNVSRVLGNNPKFTILLETFSGNIRVD